MENKKRALGRGLEELFNSDNLNLSQMEEQIYESVSKEEIIDIPLLELRANPYQPRKQFDEQALKELAFSIKEHGVFQPIIVKKSIKGYEIIAGERRVRASRLVGLDTIPAIVRDFTDIQMMEIALLENLQRQDLTAIEEAQAYKSMIDSLAITQDELSKKVGKSRSYITNMLGLLRLPNTVQAMITNRQLTMGHARVLSKLEDQSKIEQLAKQISEKLITVRQLEDLTSSDMFERKVKIDRKPKEKNDEFQYAESLLQEKYDAKVKIKEKRIEIYFANTADLNRILEIMNAKEDI